MRTLFDSGSGAAASEDAKRQSHPLRQELPVTYLIVMSRIWYWPLISRIAG